MEIREEVDSDHHPLIMWLKGNARGDRGKEGKERRRTMKREVRDEEEREEFKKEVKIGKIEGREMQQEMEVMMKKITEAEEKRRAEEKNRTELVE